MITLSNTKHFQNQTYEAFNYNCKEYKWINYNKKLKEEFDKINWAEIPLDNAALIFTEIILATMHLTIGTHQRSFNQSPFWNTELQNLWRNEMKIKNRNKRIKRKTNNILKQYEINQLTEADNIFKRLSKKKLEFTEK